MFIRERDDNMKRIAIITGASSGFGKEFALQLDNKIKCIDEYWLVARNEENLNKLSLCLNHKSKVFALDMSKPESIDTLVDAVKSSHAKIKMLINSAGYGKIDKVADMDYNDIYGMTDINCSALAVLSKRLIKYMDENSRIINIASSAAFMPQAGFAVYAATKSYVLSFTRALNAELRKNDIYATAVCPGPSPTNFFHIAEEQTEMASYKKYVMIEPDKIVEKAIIDSINKKDVSVCGVVMNAFNIATKVVPHGIILKFMS